MNADSFPADAPDGLPDVHALPDELLKCLWILQVAKDVLGENWMSPGEIESVARDVYGIGLPRQRILGLLNAARGQEVSRKKINGRWVFQILKAGLDSLEAPRESVTFVDPTAALTHIRAAEDLFRSMRGVVCVCDPYVDGRTLDFLAEADQVSEIRLLTANINKPNPFKRDLGAFASQHSVPLSVRRVAQGKLHDRYVIDAGGLLIFGTSLNSFGKKQSFVIKAGDDIKASVQTAFDAHWAFSPAFP